MPYLWLEFTPPVRNPISAHLRAFLHKLRRILWAS